MLMTLNQLTAFVAFAVAITICQVQILGVGAQSYNYYSSSSYYNDDDRGSYGSPRGGSGGGGTAGTVIGVIVGILVLGAGAYYWYTTEYLKDPETEAVTVETTVIDFTDIESPPAYTAKTTPKTKSWHNIGMGERQEAKKDKAKSNRADKDRDVNLEGLKAELKEKRTKRFP